MPGDDDKPPLPFIMPSDEPAAVDEPPLKPDWKDFVALTIAAYQVLFPVLLLLAGAVVLLLILLTLVFR